MARHIAWHGVAWVGGWLWVDGWAGSKRGSEGGWEDTWPILEVLAGPTSFPSP